MTKTAPCIHVSWMSVVHTRSMKMIPVFGNDEEQEFVSTIKTLHKTQEWQELHRNMP